MYNIEEINKREDLFFVGDVVTIRKDLKECESPVCGIVSEMLELSGRKYTIGSKYFIGENVCYSLDRCGFSWENAMFEEHIARIEEEEAVNYDTEEVYALL